MRRPLPFFSHVLFVCICVCFKRYSVYRARIVHHRQSLGIAYPSPLPITVTGGNIVLFLMWFLLCLSCSKAMESGRPQVVSVGGSWLPAPRGFLLPLGTGITFGFGCAYLLLSVLSLDHPAVAPWLLARRKPNSFLSATGPHSDHWEDEEPQAPEVPLAGHGPDDEFHHSGQFIDSVSHGFSQAERRSRYKNG